MMTMEVVVVFIRTITIIIIINLSYMWHMAEWVKALVGSIDLTEKRHGFNTYLRLVVYEKT